MNYQDIYITCNRILEKPSIISHCKYGFFFPPDISPTSVCTLWENGPDANYALVIYNDSVSSSADRMDAIFAMPLTVNAFCIPLDNSTGLPLPDALWENTL